MHANLHRRLAGLLAVMSFALALAWMPTPAHAENLIKNPGAHNRYKFELEPHLYFRYGRNVSAVGPGVRAAIPFMHNGPIDTINNNIGISFGVDMPFFNDNVILDIPVAFQWNFYFTDIISVIGEAGFLTSIWTGPGSNVDFDPIIQGGGRFQFGKVGLVVRVGYPALTVGANFQF
jgi:hypothetical protein